ncbi:MAG: Phosphate transport system permease protein PstA [Glaciecola sp. HTCC2999]|jgi:phosphate transport system permease protein|nr:MAG: Phosphate transport system permease protein PstA [Glaciecola sp. HTCC2999]
MTKLYKPDSSFITINLTATAAAILSLALVGLILYVLIKGLSYFTLYPTVNVQITDKYGDKHLHYAQLYHSDKIAEQHVISIYQQNIKKNQQLSVHKANIVYKPIIHPIWTLNLTNGSHIFASQLALHSASLSPEPVQRYSSATYSILRDEIYQLKTASRQLTSELIPLNQELAELVQRGFSIDSAEYQDLYNQIIRLMNQQQHLDEQRDDIKIFYQRADGSTAQIPLYQVDYLVNTNELSWLERMSVSALKIWYFISDDPKQSNSAGGVFPALFGTLLLVFLMTVLVMPLGVLTALYLHEYAPDNYFTIILRTIITNLAGIPAIVYGVFGLGLFVYVMGTSIDQWFYPETLPSPTFGSPGLLWAALTMALLTLPVVIVSTEEGLRQVPESLKNGAMALGATKYEMIRKIVIPIASPSIVTGGILAIARAAGEVAPLLLVGAVMSAPVLPIDNEFPYIHLERQFMHLGVLVFDGVFHSQTSISASSMMFATCLLLILIVLVLNSMASWLRYRLKQQYDWQ